MRETGRRFRPHYLLWCSLRRRCSAYSSAVACTTSQRAPPPSLRRIAAKSPMRRRRTAMRAREKEDGGGGTECERTASELPRRGVKRVWSWRSSGARAMWQPPARQGWQPSPNPPRFHRSGELINCRTEPTDGVARETSHLCSKIRAD